jgi:hypothetical protein
MCPTIDTSVNNASADSKKMKPAADYIAAGSAILRKAGRFLPETPEGSNVFASVSLTAGRKRQKLDQVNALDAHHEQNHHESRTPIRDFYRFCQKQSLAFVFRPKLARAIGFGRLR